MLIVFVNVLSKIKTDGKQSKCGKNFLWTGVIYIMDDHTLFKKTKFLLQSISFNQVMLRNVRKWRDFYNPFCDAWFKKIHSCLLSWIVREFFPICLRYILDDFSGSLQGIASNNLSSCSMYLHWYHPLLLSHRA
jgi:hypothetical protein